MFDASLDPLARRCRFINWVLSEASKVLLCITKSGLNAGALLRWIQLRPSLYSQFIFKRGISSKFILAYSLQNGIFTLSTQSLRSRMILQSRPWIVIGAWVSDGSGITAFIPTLITSLPARQENLKPNGCNYGLIRHPRSLHLVRGRGKGSSLICNSPGSINVNGPSFTQWRTRNHYVWLNCQICINMCQFLVA